ncbi:MAG: hypothetical protein K2N03_02480 [Muribaculaceae bacterium]|nr:hypothetical protein [Muribaculaceae bacterium]
MFDIEEEKERDDFFESPPPEEKPKVEKKPEFKSDDPGYWEQEESEWEHLRPHNHFKLYAWLGVSLLIIVIMIGVYLRFYSAKVEDADMYGYVESIRREGTVFKTYEGVLLPYREIMDTTRVYREDFIFSVEADSLAIEIKKLSRSGVPVRLGYVEYHSTLPWRGKSRVVVTEVERVDPKVILPPEFRPEFTPEYQPEQQTEGTPE